jgi:hypothetical protein
VAGTNGTEFNSLVIVDEPSAEKSREREASRFAHKSRWKERRNNQGLLPLVPTKNDNATAMTSGTTATPVQHQLYDAAPCPRGRLPLGHHTSKRNRRMDHHTRRTDPMNFEDVVANNNNFMHDHALEVALDDYSNLAKGISEVITEGVGI